MSTIESFLTRELDVRFIDARFIATEARISLGIEGYPTRDQVELLREEGIRIFRNKSPEEQRALQKLNLDLEAVKMPAGSMSRSVSSSSDLNSIVSFEADGRRGSVIRTRLFRR